MATQPQTVTPAPAGGSPGPITAGQASNSKAMLQAFIDASKTFGEQMGAGQVSKVSWLFDMGERIKRGDIDTDAIKPGWLAFAAAQRKRAGVRAGSGADTEVRISEAKKVAQCCQLPQVDGLKVLVNAFKIIKDNPNARGEVDDKLLKVARAQCNFPDEPLTNEQIEQLFRPREKSEIMKVDALGKLRKAIEKFATDHEWTPHVRAGHASITTQIEEWGGTSTEKRRREAEAKREAKKLAKKNKKK